MAETQNPLFDTDRLPAFAAIKPEHVEPAITALIEENRRTLAQLLEQNQHYSWDNLIEPLEAVSDRLSKAWSPVKHMNSVINTDGLRAAYNACLPKLSEFGTEVGQNEQLYQAYQQIRDSVVFAELSQAQRKTIDD